ncbi:MAG: fadJ [Gammaproteobacteria bacterium]|jgi:3-hydroxyacyl-CoA dehydrogenase/enoyl-CoA hydratase/3-hydroxybutyryl-CoA epimerase|nr:fadJ [Gammaproteobacteria bacterium]
MKQYKHWRLEGDVDQLLWLALDRYEESVNTINEEVMEEFSDILDKLTKNPDYKGLIITSAKKHGFIAGADISQFNKFKNIEEAVNLLRGGQRVFDKLENLKIPTVALINGFCLGGGLELALACRYRVAENGPKTRLGLPEVKLGIHPGWGGTVRLPRLIGVPQAFNMILSGHTISGKVAAKLGLVDAAVPQRHLVNAAKYYVLQSAIPRKIRKSNQIINNVILRRIVATYLTRKLHTKIKPEQYPAPFQVINNWEQVGIYGQAPLEKEAKTCGKLFFSETSENLVRAFFLQERLKNLAKESYFAPQHVHVIGAGTMGGDIAAWCALQGMQVTLQDREPKLIAPAIKRAFLLFNEKLKEAHLVQKAMDRLQPDITGLGISRADIIIEAIYEDLKVKQTLFQELEKQAKPQAILATNTSSIPLDEINSVMQMPGRLVGIHFFNPVPKMLLVEVVRGQCTAEKVIDNSIAFVRKIDRLPLPVKSSPGFLVNRILMPYLLESVQMLEEGVPATIIDKAMTDFGMPMGPVTLADVVGLDVCLSVATHLGRYFHTAIPTRLAALVERGQLGRKTGEGFYRYTKAGKQLKPQPQSYDKPATEIANRLVLRMLNESFACLREGVVTDADLLDAGMIFGTGFAPFRGGPMRYAKTQSIGNPESI